MLVTRTRHFASKLQPQFALGEIEKVYLARVLGSPRDERFTCDAPISLEPGEVGTREVDYDSGASARTEFRIIKYFADGTTLLEARPLTGRTNQIRVHLWELNLPICGDPAYLLKKQLGQTQTISITDKPLCLHSWKILFNHPLTNQRMSFTTSPPSWAEA